jgi:hypothetical protein
VNSKESCHAQERQAVLFPALAVDPIGETLADVYVFLLRKAAQRKNQLQTKVEVKGEPAVLGSEASGHFSRDVAS